MEEIKVIEGGERIDKFLADKLNYSRSQINKMLDKGFIVVNKNLVKTSYKTKENDIITILEEYKEESNVVPEKMELDIIFEDADIIVLNKKAGVVVHPGSGNKTHTLASGLMYHTKNLSDLNDERPGIVHRLDKEPIKLIKY